MFLDGGRAASIARAPCPGSAGRLGSRWISTPREGSALKLGLLVNRDAAAGLALTLLAPALREHELGVFYTDRATPPDHPLAGLAAFDRELLARLSVFEDTGAELANDINGADLERWRAWAPDLAISIRHMSILRPAAIDVPRLGVINLHSGELPAYQGVMATFWAMSRREPTVGTTLHAIEDAQIDRGGIFARTSEATRYDRSYLWNVLNLYRAGCENIVAAVRALADGRALEAMPQRGEGRYFTFPTEQDLAAFPWPLFDPADSIDEFLGPE